MRDEPLCSTRGTSNAGGQPPSITHLRYVHQMSLRISLRQQRPCISAAHLRMGVRHAPPGDMGVGGETEGGGGGGSSSKMQAPQNVRISSSQGEEG